MKKIFFMAAVAALALSSCSSTEEVLNAPEQVAENAIGFDVYAARKVSRAATSDVQNINLDELKTRAFGVFAYSTGAMELESYVANNTFPNFMYNQIVSFNDNDADPVTAPKDWEYSPVKYWPNEKNDLVSFQAFAPYYKDADAGYTTMPVAESAVFGKQYNGVGIRYEAAEKYDLMWGAKKTSGAGAGDPDIYESYANVFKPSVTDGELLFTFQHALSKVDVNVQINVDEVCNDTDNSLTDNNVLAADTEVKINYVKLVGQVPDKGVLSLYDGQWTIESINEGAYVFTNKDFEYAITDLEKYYAEATYKQETTTYASAHKPGSFVTHDTNKMDQWLTPKDGWMVIPVADPTNHKVYVEVSYDVITEAGTGNDAHNKSVVTNTIKSDVPLTIAANAFIKLYIHLGLTSAKFDVEVDGWTDGGTDEYFNATKNQ